MKMCGIFFTFGVDPELAQQGANALRHRGPDHATLHHIQSPPITMAFHRLKINDLTDAGNQPMYAQGVYLLCNGEIYNHATLTSHFDLAGALQSTSDCETVLHTYLHLKATLNSAEEAAKYLPEYLDAEFAFVLYDTEVQLVIAARDPHGVRPLFFFPPNPCFGYASELKALHAIAPRDTVPFPPGHLDILSLASTPPTRQRLRYHSPLPLHSHIFLLDDETYALAQIRTTFTNAVTKRLMSDRPLCALLSGGLDSSLVAALVARAIHPHPLHTFSIGIPGSTDLHYAALVAKHIGSTHHEILLTAQDFLDAVPETIRIIESYDVTSVRASVGNLLVAKHIAQHSDFKVVFNGDYSDEVTGGYLYLHNAPSTDAFHDECVRLTNDIYLFDSLRSDRTISNQGLEARVPFADKTFVRTYLSIDPALRRPTKDRPEKYLLRKAFDDPSAPLLPPEVLWRKKEAFSDGVSHPDNSWHHILQKHIQAENATVWPRCLENPHTSTPIELEAKYYKSIFLKHYPGAEHVIPYSWLPKWSGDIQDPSARELLAVTDKSG